MSKMITQLFAAAGIETSYKADGETRARPDCGFHSLRHTYVTQLERLGATLAERQLLAGHNTAAMALHYTHNDASRVLALPDITSPTAEPPDGTAEPDALIRAFREIVDQMDAAQLSKAKQYIKGVKK